MTYDLTAFNFVAVYFPCVWVCAYVNMCGYSFSTQ